MSLIDYIKGCSPEKRAPFSKLATIGNNSFIEMKRLVLFLALAVSLVFCACGGGSKHGDSKFAGTFTDEFNDKFELREDYTGTIQFDGNDKKISITWSDGENHKRPFATISFNGDPAYYYLRDGSLYRQKEDMENGRCAIKITYDD